MSCNCNTANPTCEPCAICTPPGVVGLTTCQPPDPCPDGSLDIDCVIYNGSNFSCASVQNGDTLISVLLEILAKIFPQSYCCGLQGTTNYSSCGLAGTITYSNCGLSGTTSYNIPTTTSTTTTTLVPIPCNFYQFVNSSQTGPSIISYVPCNCNYRTTQVVGNQSVTICVNNSFSVVATSGSVLVSQQGPCTLPPCPTTTSSTTTTTSTSTSTTSTTSTTTTTTLCPCQSYTFTGGTAGPTVYNIVNCPGAIVQTLTVNAGQSTVRCIDNDYVIIRNSGNGTAIPGGCNCQTTTTSTTSTTTTSSTTTTTTVCPQCPDNNSRIHYDNVAGDVSNFNVVFTGITGTYNYNLTDGAQGPVIPPGIYNIVVTMSTTSIFPDNTLSYLSGDSCISFSNQCYKMALGTAVYSFNNVKIGCLHQIAVTGTYSPSNPNYQYFADIRFVIGVVSGNTCLPAPTPITTTTSTSTTSTSTSTSTTTSSTTTTTSSTTSTTTLEPTTTSTTSTTTEEPTTTTTTICPCTEYYNNAGITLNGISYIDCVTGNNVGPISVGVGQSFCSNGNPLGGDSAFLSVLQQFCCIP